MQSHSNRSTIIISGLATLLILSGAALALGFHNGWLRTESREAMPDAVGAESQPSDARNVRGTPIEAKPSPAGSTQAATEGAAAAVYRQKLDEAYRALDEAYAQIRVLQAPQVRLASSDDSDERGTAHDGNDDRRERRSRRHGADDR